ncbi:MAG TPA: orotidine-5'-phosphate decarboxylase [Cytophagaceae bacterium]|jgi:orotidine-5'-phosphate decarboxylase|nr:orotidine-5'-phosphate decarboxylase [Cytophagaceae bacterium]
MKKAQLVSLIKEKKSLLCVGLDTDLEKIPVSIRNSSKDPVFEFNKHIIDATLDSAVSYKPNTAFYEAMGLKGWESLQKTIDYIGDKAFVIADAKRGDIGNTSKMYAKAFFEEMKAHAVTVAPYMGEDSVTPFLGYDGKWVIVLGLTSNKGSEDFQQLTLQTNQKLYLEVIRKVASWGASDQLMFVVGATQAEYIQSIRAVVPEHFLLIPGVGAQGGDLDAVCKYGVTKDGGLLINASRSILYASSGNDFQTAAAAEAEKMRVAMEKYI